MQLTRDAIFEAVREERERQDNLRGGRVHDRGYSANDWVAFITQYAGFAVDSQVDGDFFRRCMIQVAAVALAAVECQD